MKTEKLTHNIQIRNLTKVNYPKLVASKVLTIGTGKLAAKVMANLVSSGVGTIGIMEYKKPEKLIPQLLKFNHNVIIHQHDENLNSPNIDEIIKGYDIVIDCLGDYNSKFLLNKLAVKNKTTLLYSSITKRYGQVATIIPNKTACLNCIYSQKDLDNFVSNAENSIISDGIAAVLGDIASCIILELEHPAINQMMSFGICARKFNLIPLSPRSNCKICSKEKIAI